MPGTEPGMASGQFLKVRFWSLLFLCNGCGKEGISNCLYYIKSIQQQLQTFTIPHDSVNRPVQLVPISYREDPCDGGPRPVGTTKL